MLDILNNGWFVGIGTGILSGLLVWWVTNKLFSKRDEQELARNIDLANREVIYALRSEVSEEQVPAINVVEALISATARRYKLEARYLYRPKQIAEELIKEIMDSSFISSAAKRTFCEKLQELTPPVETALDRQAQKEAQALVAKVEYREKTIMLFSMTLGMISAIATLYASIRSNLSSSTLGGKVFESLLPMMIILFVVVFLMNVMVTLMKMRHKRLRQEMGVPASEENSNIGTKT